MVHKLFEITERDRNFYDEHLKSRLPDYIFDAHVHLAKEEHTVGINPELLNSDWALQCACYMNEEQLNKYSNALFPKLKYNFTALPMPIKGVDLEENNRYISALSAPALAAVIPQWGQEYCEALLISGFAGFKPYPSLVSTVKGAEISIFDFITPAQLDLLNRHKKTVLLHLPRAGRLPDDNNINDLRTIRQTWPDIKIIIAHFGRCFNIEPFLEGTKKLGDDLNGFYFDTAAVLNPEVYNAALGLIEPDKILFGSDLPIMLWHGRRTWNNGRYQNLCRESFPWNKHINVETEKEYTFFIYEQLKSLLDSIGNNLELKRKIFFKNAEKVYFSVK